MENLTKAIALHEEDRLDCGEEIPKSDTVSLPAVGLNAGDFE